MLHDLGLAHPLAELFQLQQDALLVDHARLLAGLYHAENAHQTAAALLIPHQLQQLLGIDCQHGEVVETLVDGHLDLADALDHRCGMTVLIMPIYIQHVYTTQRQALLLPHRSGNQVHLLRPQPAGTTPEGVVPAERVRDHESPRPQEVQMAHRPETGLVVAVPLGLDESHRLQHLPQQDGRSLHHRAHGYAAGQLHAEDPVPHRIHLLRIGLPKQHLHSALDQVLRSILTRRDGHIPGHQPHSQGGVSC